MKRWKQFFQEKVVVSAAMCVLLAVVLTTATTAWYAVNNTDSLFGLQLKTGGTGNIKVAVKEGGPDIMEDENLPKPEGVPVISINLKDFENVESQKVAPGAYGPLTFYITSLSQSITSYELKVQMEYRPMGKVTAEQKEKIESMIRNHIFVYEEKYNGTDAEGKPAVLFRKPLTFYKDEDDEDATAATGPLTFEEEKRVDVYWVWNYELTDIPDYQNTALYQANNGDIRKAVRAYDEEDTILGNCVQDIWFNVRIVGSSRAAGGGR